MFSQYLSAKMYSFGSTFSLFLFLYHLPTVINSTVKIIKIRKTEKRCQSSQLLTLIPVAHVDG